MTVPEMSTLDLAKSIQRAMRRAYDDLISFVETPEFQKVYDELYALPTTERPDFVKTVLLNPNRLRERGVIVPEGILIQRSAFGDRRPTLFCVKKYLPKELQVFWQNVNITFDNEPDTGTVPRDQRAWRKPLPVEAQSLLMSNGLTAEELGVD